ncbi:MAG: hypothetical protein ABIE55_01315 [Candidatus Aenigmatarchaeota archaeon]
MEKIIFGGRGSKNDPVLEGLYNKEELSKNGIKVTDPTRIESCHGCPDIVEHYSKETQYFANNDDRVVGVLIGGLSFALPGIQGTHVTYPIISVPLDMVAYQNFMLPSGHAVTSTVGIERKLENGYTTTQRKKALTIAENILNLDTYPVAIRGDGDLEKLEKELDEIGIVVDDDSDLILSYGSKPLTDVDEKCIQIWADTQSSSMSGSYMDDTERFLARTPNTVQVRGLKNLEIYAAKILSLNDPEMREAIKKIGENKRKDYNVRSIIDEIFTRD